MKTDKKMEVHIGAAITRALIQLGTLDVISPKGMIAFNKAIKSYVREELWKNKLFIISGRSNGHDEEVLKAGYEFILNKINETRALECELTKGDYAVAHYGPWVVDEDGMINYGGNEVYYHKETWHEDQHHLSHMMTKVWLQDTAADYLRALAHSAKIQGVKSFTVNVERITTEK